MTISSTTEDRAHRTVTKPVSHTAPVTASIILATAGNQHFNPARPSGLLEPYAAMSGTYGSEGGPPQQCGGPTRRASAPRDSRRMLGVLTSNDSRRPL